MTPSLRGNGGNRRNTGRSTGANTGETVAEASPERLAELRQAIQAYLEAHPSAADNAVGIKRWWLPPSAANGALSDVAVVLAAMVAEGFLQTQQLPGGHVIFERARSRSAKN
jgi:hypothetical protein